MTDVSFSSLAESDLEDIFVYLADSNPNAAKKFIREISQKFKLLANNPQLGRTRDEFIHNLRSFAYKNYTVFYFPAETGVEIYRVLHGARSIEDLFENYFEGLKP